MKKLLFLNLAFCSILLQAQDPPSSMNPPAPSVIARLSLVSPKLIAEIAPVDHFTLTAGFWIRASLYRQNAEGKTVYHPSVSPSITLEPRYYFNLEQRAAKGKRIDYYSGWYLGLPFILEFPDIRFTMGGVIGFQRTLGRRWYWHISFGPGITYSESRFFLDGAGDVGLGIILNKMPPH